MRDFFQLRESKLQEKTTELAGVTLQHMEHCPGAVAAFKRNLKDGASEADVAKAAKAVDAYLAIEDRAIKAGKATDDDVEEMEDLIDRAEKVIAKLGLKGHTYHDMHLDRVEDMVEDDDEDDEDDDEDDLDEQMSADRKPQNYRKSDGKMAVRMVPTVKEKTLTPAEKKKREEIAKAIERENPNMPMDKKMAIATASAKKVAEAAPKLKHMVDPLKKAREQDRAHDASMGRTATGRKKTMTSTQRSMASMRREEVNEISDRMKDRYIQKSMGDRQHANAVRKDAEATGNKDLAAKMRDRMKKRNKGMTRAFGGERD